ncbi:MAG: hypothetical protein ACFB0Z_09605 [Candidatus Phaeomarinobacter sp.]
MVDSVFTAVNAAFEKAAIDLDDDAPFEARLMTPIRALVELFAADADLHRIIMHEGKTANDRTTWLVETHLRPAYDGSIALIGEGQAAGLVRDGDPTLLHYTIISIAGTVFSLSPEIKLLDPDSKANNPHAVTALIRDLLMTRPAQS